MERCGQAFDGVGGLLAEGGADKGGIDLGDVGDLADAADGLLQVVELSEAGEGVGKCAGELRGVFQRAAFAVERAATDDLVEGGLCLGAGVGREVGEETGRVGVAGESFEEVAGFGVESFGAAAGAERVSELLKLLVAGEGLFELAAFGAEGVAELVETGDLFAVGFGQATMEGAVERLLDVAGEQIVRERRQHLLRRQRRDGLGAVPGAVADVRHGGRHLT